MAKHVVAPAHELPPGSRKRVTVGDRSIAVFNIGGELFALLDRCPHKGGSLCEGKLTGLVQSPQPGVYRYSRAGEILRCPWHGWEFDIRTGKSHCDPKRVRAKSYPVTVEPGGELAEGPCEVETFAISIEQAYVVLTL
ncbi:MAG: Rieske (2Fe-2S) protein [Hyphomicrobiales bacterium]|nr:Rieske (2Fe-2S) protein [Hyphomicrobiales bacterium]